MWNTTNNTIYTPAFSYIKLSITYNKHIATKDGQNMIEQTKMNKTINIGH